MYNIELDENNQPIKGSAGYFDLDSIGKRAPSKQGSYPVAPVNYPTQTADPKAVEVQGSPENYPDQASAANLQREQEMLYEDQWGGNLLGDTGQFLYRGVGGGLYKAFWQTFGLAGSLAELQNTPRMLSAMESAMVTGDAAFGNALTEFATKMNGTAPEIYSNNRFDAGWWTEGTASLASFLPSLALGYGVGAGTARLAALAGASPAMAKLAGTAIGGLTMRHAENYTQAADTYKRVFDEAMMNGESYEVASQKAGEMAAEEYKLDSANIVFDMFQLATVLKPLSIITRGGMAAAKTAAAAGIAFSLPKAIMSKVAKLGALESMSEGVEEMVNEIATQEANDGTPMQGNFLEAWGDIIMNKRDKYLNNDKVWDSFIFGMAGGAVANLALGSMNKEARLSLEGKIRDVGARHDMLKELIGNENKATTYAEKHIARQSMMRDYAMSAVVAGNVDVALEQLKDLDSLADSLGIPKGSPDVAWAASELKETLLDTEKLYKRYSGVSIFNNTGLGVRAESALRDTAVALASSSKDLLKLSKYFSQDRIYEQEESLGHLSPLARTRVMNKVEEIALDAELAFIDRKLATLQPGNPEIKVYQALRVARAAALDKIKDSTNQIVELLKTPQVYDTTSNLQIDSLNALDSATTQYVNQTLIDIETNALQVGRESALVNNALSRIESKEGLDEFRDAYNESKAKYEKYIKDQLDKSKDKTKREKASKSKGSVLQKLFQKRVPNGQTPTQPVEAAPVQSTPETGSPIQATPQNDFTQTEDGSVEALFTQLNNLLRDDSEADNFAMGSEKRREVAEVLNKIIDKLQEEGVDIKDPYAIATFIKEVMGEPFLESIWERFQNLFNGLENTSFSLSVAEAIAGHPVAESEAQAARNNLADVDGNDLGFITNKARQLANTQLLEFVASRNQQRDPDDTRIVNAGSAIGWLALPYETIVQASGLERIQSVAGSGLNPDLGDARMMLPGYYMPGTKLTLSIDTAFSRDGKTYESLLAKEKAENRKNAYVPIAVKNGDLIVGYVHDIDWIRPYNVVESVDGVVDNISQQRSILMSLRDQVIRNNGTMEVTITNKGFGSLELIDPNNPNKRLRTAAALKSPGIKYAVSRNGAFYTDKDTEVKAVNAPTIDGVVHALVPLINDAGYLALRLDTLPLDKTVINTLMSSIDTFITEDVASNEQALKASNQNINLLQAAGMRKLIETYIYTTNITDELSAEIQKAKGNKIYIAIRSNGIDFQRTGQKKFGLTKDLLRSNPELYNKVRSTLAEYLSEMFYKVSLLDMLNTNLESIIASESGWTAIKGTYTDYIKDVTSTNIREESVNVNGKTEYIHLFQPVINIEPSVKDAVSMSENNISMTLEDERDAILIAALGNENGTPSIEDLRSFVDLLPNDPDILQMRRYLAEAEVIQAAIVERDKPKDTSIIEDLGLDVDAFAAPFEGNEESNGPTYEPKNYLVDPVNFDGYKQNVVVNLMMASILNWLQTDRTLSVYQAYKRLYDAYSKLAAMPEHASKFGPIVNNFEKLKELSKNRLEQLEFLTITERFRDGARFNVDGSDNPDQRYDVDSMQVDPKDSVSGRLRMFLSFVNSGEQSYLGPQFPEYKDYDEVMNTLHTLLVGVEPNLDAMIKVLNDNATTHKWIPNLINKLNKASDEVKNEFTMAMRKQYSRHKMVTWTEWRTSNPDGSSYSGYTVKVIDSDQSGVARTIMDSWYDNLSRSTLVTFKDGKPILDSDKRKAFIERMPYVREEAVKGNLSPLDAWLREIGIELAPETLSALNKPKGAFRGITTLSDLFDSKRGVFYNIVDRMKGNETSEEDDLLALNNPMINNSGIVELATLDAKYRPYIYSNSFRDANNNQVYSYAMPSFLSDRIEALKHDPKLLEDLSESAFSRNSSFLEQLKKTESFFSKHFGISYADGIVQTHSNADGVKLDDMSPGEYLVYSLGLHTNSSLGEPGRGRKIGHYLLPTFSDKPRKAIVTVQRHDTQVIFKDWKKQIVDFGGTTSAELKRLVDAEINRIVEFSKHPDKAYSEGYKYFYFFPTLNTIEEVRDSKGVFIDSPENRETLYKEAIAYTKDLISRRYNQFKKAGIIETTEGNVYNRKAKATVKGEFDTINFVDTRYIKDTVELNTNDQTQHGLYLAADFVINNLIVNANLYQLVLGDPALYYKGNKKDPSPLGAVRSTYDNINKRLAMMLAPGHTLANAAQSVFNYVFLNDDSDVSANYAQIEKILTDRGLDPTPYTSIEGTNAQEYTTLKEHLNVMYDMGRISKSYMEELIYKSDSETLNDLDIKFILQPIKPVYSYISYEPQYRTHRVLYVKTSSFPLFKQLTKGHSIDNLREAMEKAGVDRATYKTGTKVGGRNYVNVFDGNHDFDSVENLEAAFKANLDTVSRAGFRIQQEVPYDPYKQEATKGSQETKLLFLDLLDDPKFSEIKDRYDALHKDLYTLKSEAFYEEVTKDGRLNIPKIKNMLVDEAKSRGMSAYDIDSLETFINSMGEEQFTVPVYTHPLADKFESLLISLVNKKVIKQKFPGKSFVLGSELGFKKTRIAETYNLNDPGIVYVPGFDPSKGLLPQSSKNGAQVLIPFKFRNTKGELEDVRKYIKDGRIDTDKIPLELLQLFGFRIPTQGHNSMSYIEVVGFLPESAGDLIIAPKDFTEQMGSDFDIDKLYTYMYNTRPVIDYDAYNSKLEEFEKLKQVSMATMTPETKKYFSALIVESKAAYRDRDLAKLERVQSDIQELLSNPMLSSLRDELASIQSNILKWERDDSTPIKKIQNAILDIHFEVLKDPEVLPNILNPLGFGGLDQIAEDVVALRQERSLKGGSENKRIYEQSLISDEYYQSTYANGIVGKAMTGIKSLDSTFNAAVQGKRLSFYDSQAEASLGIVFEDGIERSRLSDIESVDGNNKSYHIAGYQSSAVDNAKEQILGKINSNAITAAAERAILQVGFEGRHAAYLTSQDIILEFVEEYKRLTDSTSTPVVGDKKNIAAATVAERYLKKMSDPTYIGNENASVTIEEMRDMIRLGSDFSGYYKLQIDLLAKFLHASRLGESLGDIQRAINTDSSGLGKNFIEVLSKAKSVYNSVVSNPIVSNSVNVLGKPMFDDNGKIVDFDPDTINGYATKYGLMPAATVFTDLFPYKTPVFQYVLKEISTVTGKETIGAEIGDEAKKKIWNGLKSYMFAAHFSENTDLNVLRASLLFDVFAEDGTITQKSLATRVKEYSQTPEGRKNIFLSKLDYDLSSENGKPSILKYTATKGENFDEDNTYQGLIDLLANPKTSALAYDMIAYQYVTGGIQQAINFVRYIPVSYLKFLKMDELLRKFSFSNFSHFRVDTKMKGNRYNVSPFVRQWVQHNPFSVPRIQAREVDATVEKVWNKDSKIGLPETFTLPPVPTDLAAMAGFKAAKLLDGANRYPSFISIRDSASGTAYRLYALTYDKNFEGRYYMRIDTLGGNYGMSEYSYYPPGEVAGSVFPANKSPFTVSYRKALVSNLTKQDVTEATDFRDKYALFSTDEYVDTDIVLDELINNAVNSEYRELAMLFKKVLPLVNPNLKFQSATPGTDPYFAQESKKNVTGVYFNSSHRTNKNTIKIRKDVKMSENKYQYIMLHELGHAITVETMHDIASRGLADRYTKEQIAAVQKLERLRLHVIDGIKQGKYDYTGIYTKDNYNRYNTLAAKTELTAEEKTEIQSLVYMRALENSREFVTMLLSDLDVRNGLNLIPYADSSITKKIIEYVKKILSSFTKVSPGSVLESGLDALFTIVGVESDSVASVPALINSATSNDPEVIPLFTNFSRQSVANDSQYLYLFTDNASRTSGNNTIPNESKYTELYGKGLKYPNTTQAVIRGLDNAFPITTMVDDNRTQWKDSQFEEYKKIIDDEINTIKEAQTKFKGIKFAAQMPFGQGKISNMKQSAPKIWNYLNEKLVEIGIDNTGTTPKFVEQPINKEIKPGEYTNHSGGAKGGDMQGWDAIGREFGVTNHIHYTVAYYDKLTEQEKTELDKQYLETVKFLGRGVISKDTYAGKLVRRDMIQANNGESIYGVTELIKPGIKGRKGYNNKMSYSVPEGGTGYATARGILLNKPTYVFNQSDKYGNEIGWYKWDNNVKDFVKTDTPTLSKNFTGIGSQEINELGLQAIRDVYKKIVNQPTEIKPTVIRRANSTNNTDSNIDLGGFNANEEQVAAIRRIEEWLDESDSPTLTLNGYAGTGKTTLMKYVLSKSPFKYAVTATTHKAVHNIAKLANTAATTVHKLFGIRPNASLANFTFNDTLFGEGSGSLIRKQGIKFVVIDESSMLNDDIYKTIVDVAKASDVKVLFLGDEAQLPPVEKEANNKLSKVFTDNEQVRLTKVERTALGNPLIALFTYIRNNIGSPYTNTYQTAINSEGLGVQYLKNQTSFIDTFIARFTESNNLDNARIVAYANKTVAFYNNQVRIKMFGSYDATTNRYTIPDKYVVGDKVMSYYTEAGEDAAFINSQDYTVTKVEPSTVDIKGTNVKTIKITIKAADLPEFDVNILDLSDQFSKETYIKAYNEYEEAHQAAVKSKDKLRAQTAFNVFSAFRDSVYLNEDIVIGQAATRTGVKYDRKAEKQIDYAYAVTIHKSQGSTYQHVFVDETSIKYIEEMYRNKGQAPNQANQARYVAYTRAAKSAIVYAGNQALEDNADALFIGGLELLDDIPTSTEAIKTLPLKQQLQIRLQGLYKNLGKARGTKDLKKIATIESQIARTQEEIDILDGADLVEDVVRIGIDELSGISRRLSASLDEADLNYLNDSIYLWLNISELMRESLLPATYDIYKDQLLDLEKEASVLKRRHLDLAKKLVQARSVLVGTSQPNQDIFQPSEDIGWGTANLLDLSRSNVPVLMMADKVAREVAFDELTEYRQFQELLAESMQDFKDHEEFKKNGYEVFLQKDADGNKTGKLVSPYSSTYYKMYSSYKGAAKNPKNRKANAQFAKFLRENVLAFDVRALFYADYKAQGGTVTFTKDEIKAKEDYIRGIIGDSLYESSILRQREKLDRWFMDLTGEKARVAELSITDEEKKERIDEYIRLRSPFNFIEWYLNPALDATLPKVPDGIKYVEQVPRREVNGKPTEWYDKNYNRIEADPVLLKTYDFIVNSMRKYTGYLPEDVTYNTTANFLPIMEKLHGGLIDGTVDYYKSYSFAGFKHILGDSWTGAVTQNIGGEYTRNIVDPATGKERPDFGFFFLPKKDNTDILPEDRYYNIPQLLETFAKQSIHYKHRSRVQDILYLANTVLQDSKQLAVTPKKNPVLNWITKKAQTTTGLDNQKRALQYFIEAFHGRKREIEGAWDRKKLTYAEKKLRSKLVKDLLKLDQELAEKRISIATYNERSKLIEEKLDSIGNNITWGRIGDTLLQYMQLKGMGWAPMSAVNNITWGFISNMMWASRQEDFDSKSFFKAMGMLTKTAVPDLARDHGPEWLKEATKIANAMVFFDVVKDVNDASYAEYTDSNKASKTARDLMRPLELQRRGEYFNQGASFLATMLHTKVNDLQGNSKSLYEALNEDMTWNTAEFGEEPEGLITDFKLHVDQMNKLIHGNYDPNSPIMFKRSFIGRAIMQFRSWIPEGWATRFGGLKWDPLLKRETKGRYTTFKDIAKGESLLMGIGLNIRTLTAEAANKLTFDRIGYLKRNGAASLSSGLDAANMRQNASELIILAALMLIWSLLKAAWDDEEDEEAKVALMRTMNVVNRLEDDAMFFYNPMAVESIAQNFIPATRIIIDFSKFLGAWYDRLINDDDVIATGPRAGESKTRLRTLKLIPGASGALRYTDTGEIQEK